MNSLAPFGRPSVGRPSRDPGLALSRPAASRHSLSARLLWLTVFVVLVTEAVVFLPSLGRARHAWLASHMVQAHVAALSVAAAPPGALTDAVRDELLRLTGTELIRLDRAGRTPVVLEPGEVPAPARRVDLRTESSLASMGRALADLVRGDDRLILVTAAFPPDTVVTTLLHNRNMVTDIRLYARSIIGLSLMTAGITGALIYACLLLLLVRPMRRITGSIAAFRADPERAVPLDATRVTLMPDDEIGLAGQELAAMQRELRAALWRNARLAALGTAVAKVSHDLRGILSPALLSAERLETAADPAVQRAGEVVADSVQRATDMVRRTLEFAREGPAPPGLTRLRLARLVDETAEAISPRPVAAPSDGFAVENRVAPALTVEADRDQLFRVLVNLLRNAAEAGATRAWIAAVRADPGGVDIEVGDNGPGLPAAVRATLFRPFTSSGRTGGTGLGLAIVRDLMRAHGGDIALATTGGTGTVFRLRLPSTDIPED